MCAYVLVWLVLMFFCGCRYRVRPRLLTDESMTQKKKRKQNHDDATNRSAEQAAKLSKSVSSSVHSPEIPMDIEIDESPPSRGPGPPASAAAAAASPTQTAERNKLSRHNSDSILVRKAVKFPDSVNSPPLGSTIEGLMIPEALRYNELFRDLNPLQVLHELNKLQHANEQGPIRVSIQHYAIDLCRIDIPRLLAARVLFDSFSR